MTYNIKTGKENTKDMDHNNSSRRFRPWGSRVIPERPGVPTICMEYSEIPGRIQMGQFIPVEIFRKKNNTFRGITFFPFLPKRPKFSVPFVWITSARVHFERKWNIYWYFVNGATQSLSCFRCQKKNTSTIWRKFFNEISVQMVSAPKPSERLRLVAVVGSNWFELRNQSWIQNDPLFWLFHIVCTRWLVILTKDVTLP